MTFKRFFTHLVAMAILLLLVFGIVMMWLKFYTNHGQKLELKNYIGKSYTKAAQHAEDKSFQLIVKDSIHKVGQPGGIILSQNPPGGSTVKENRKIYVDVTKYIADEISLDDLSAMYGRNFESKKNELKYLDIESEVRNYKQDPGEPDHILEVWYEGRMIDGENGRKKDVKIKKGGTLGFVLSKIGGGQVQIPDFVCNSFAEVDFISRMNKLQIGSVEYAGAITDKDKAYVISQSPSYREGLTITMGSTIEIVIQQEQPESCK